MAKGVSTAAIVDAAFEVLDEVGMEGLTLRAVAERLGVKAPALYWHMRDKQDMLDEMGTRVWREVSETAARTTWADWREAFAGYARIARRALLAHRDGARVFSGTFLTDAAVLRSQEDGLAWMQGQGFPVRATTEGFAILTSFVIGHCIEEQARAQAPDDRYALAARDERVGAAEHPLVAASGEVMAHGDADARFERMLGIVLEGIATTRRPRPGDPHAAGRTTRTPPAG